MGSLRRRRDKEARRDELSFLLPPRPSIIERKVSLKLHQSFEEMEDDEIEQRSFEAGEELENESIEKG